MTKWRTSLEVLDSFQQQYNFRKSIQALLRNPKELKTKKISCSTKPEPWAALKISNQNKINQKFLL